MKTCFALIGAYLFLCIAGTALGGFLVMLYNSAATLVAGSESVEFLLDTFLNGAILSFPVCVAVSGLFLILVIIRHSARKSAVGVITVVVLGLVSWGVCLPLYFNLFSAKATFSPPEKIKMSPGYFRELDGDIYYFTSVDGKNIASGLVIKSDENNLKQLYLIDDFPANDLAKGDFSDILIGNTLEMPRLIKACLKGAEVFITSACKSWNRGWLDWLCYSSAGIALMSVISLFAFSSWRLVNAVSVMVIFNAIMIFNLCYHASLFTKVDVLLRSWQGGFLQVLNYPFAVIVNGVLIIVMCAVGIVSLIVSRKRSGREESL